MEKGSFCFLTDQYFRDFPDDMLMKNKEVVNGALHNRPCFFAFPDDKDSRVTWLVPVSTKVEKYKKYYDKKIARYGSCYTLAFGNVAGRDSVFLVQNMCPATSKYISNIYVDCNKVPIKVDYDVAETVIKCAKKTLNDYYRGIPVIFPNVKAIKLQLEQQLDKELLEQAKPLVPRRESFEEKVARAKAISAERAKNAPPRPPKSRDNER